VPEFMHPAPVENPANEGHKWKSPTSRWCRTEKDNCLTWPGPNT